MELTVVLAILAILAAMIGGALTAWVRLSRFEKNEANARTVYQAAQIALTRRQTAGTLEEGTVRLSVSAFNQPWEMDAAARQLRQVCSRAGV